MTTYARSPSLDPQQGDALTPRQREAGRLLAEGLTNQEIADRMGCAVSTAEVHIKFVSRKAGVKGRVRLAFWCREVGL